MTTLYVPLHLPTAQTQRFLDRELNLRVVESVHVRENLMIIEHRRPTLDEIVGMSFTGYIRLNEYDQSSIML